MQDCAAQGKVEYGRAAHRSAGLFRQGTVVQGKGIRAAYCRTVQGRAKWE